MTDLRARFDELAMEGINRDSWISLGSDRASSSDGANSVNMRAVPGSRGITTGRTAPHPFSLPPTPSTPSHSRSQTTHPFASAWALKNAAPPVSPGHGRSHSALPVLASSSTPAPSRDKLKSFTPLSPEDDQDDPEDGEDEDEQEETTPTAERVRSRTGGGNELAIPPSPTAYPVRPSSQPTFPFSPSDDEDDPYLLHVTPSNLQAHRRSLSTASSTSSISLPLPYRPSTSSDTAPLLPALPSPPMDLPRPRTTNELDRYQKEQLRRRTRKLEQLLGTTHFAAGSEDESAPSRHRPDRREVLVERRPSTAGARLVRARTASGPPTAKGSRFPVPLSPLPRVPSISTLGSNDRIPASLDSPSMSISSDFDDSDVAEKDKRRRRQTLQKIHRYLGVMVPAEVVAPSSTGLGVPLPLPPLSPASPGASNWPWIVEDKKSAWKTLFTRSGSSGTKMDEPVWKPSAVGVGVGTRRVVPRVRDGESGAQTTPEERARNVRRAAKMEQVFGSPPPPALYVSRPAGAIVSLAAPGSPVGSRRRARSHESPRRPAALAGITVTMEEEIELDEPSPMPISAGLGTRPTKMRERVKSDGAVDAAEALESASGTGTENPSYLSYRRSLASLDYLTQKGNRNSLASLLAYISESEEHETQDPFSTAARSSPALSHSYSPAPGASAQGHDAEAPDAETASLISFALSSPDPTDLSPTPAPPAWKRAAKLRKFFGVSYRELFDQLLERIELGAREDRDRGALTSEEFEIVVKELRSLRDRREGLPCDVLR